MRDERLASLQAFTAALSSAVGMKDVARVVIEQGLDDFGAKAIGIVWMMTPGKLELVYGHGLSTAEFRLLDDAARAGERLPIRDAIVSRRPVWLECPDAIRERYPVLEPLRARRGEHGCAVVPLVIGRWCPGVIGFTFDEPRHYSDEDRSFIEVMAHLSAQAFERARLYEAEERARRAAERVGRVQESVMAIVGHDLRTPLGSISLSAGLLLRDPALPPHLRRGVERIVASAARMSEIIRDLVDASRVREGHAISIRTRQADVSEIVRHALHEFPEAQEEGRLALVAPDSAVAELDPARFSQVVSNLVGNALQHGGGAPVRIELREERDDLVLTVHNDGPPIAEALLPHLFEPFRRGERDGAHADAGDRLGLGLWIVKEIALAHGGDVTVASDRASGTTFTVRLPRSGPRAAPARSSAGGPRS